MEKIRTRIAPSPTGKFHIGTARTALFNYLFASQNKGEFLLRFEDTDKERSTLEFENDIRKGLEWLGLGWDAEYRQMDRLPAYKMFAEKLVKKECAYKKDGALWFKIEKGKEIGFRDLIRGEIKFNTDEFEDFVIVRKDGIPTFYFSNVVDDAEMKITHVIRGDDHITNTPKQILIAQALGFEIPQYAHIPLILNPDKSKLSKRAGAVSVSEYRKKGYLPEAIINFLALLGWNPGDEREYFTIEELTKEFKLEKVHKAAAVFNIEKLNSINSHYIRKLGIKELALRVTEVSELAKRAEKSYLEKILTITKDRLRYLAEFDELAAYFFAESKYNQSLLVFKKSTKTKTKKGLALSLENLSKLTSWPASPDDFNKILQNAADNASLSPGDVFWPVRAALSGLEASPSPAELLWALGKEESTKRINKAIDKLK